MTLSRSKFQTFLILVLLVAGSISFLGSTSSAPGGMEGMGNRGKTIVVNGSGGGDYTRIQWAVDNASDGDTVYVEVGTYHENLTISGKTIDLIGENNSTTFIEVSENETCLTLDSSNCKIAGFNFSGGEKNVIETGDDNNTISGNIFYNNGLVLIETMDNNISSNTFINSEIEMLESLRDRVENNYLETECTTNIFLYKCLNITIQNNGMIGGDIKFTLEPTFFSHYQYQGQSGTLDLHLKEYVWSHSITNNYLNSKPMYYYTSQNGFSVPKNAIWVVISKCSDFEIIDVDTIGALYISDSEKGEIKECTFNNSSSPLLSWTPHDIAVCNSSSIRISSCDFMYSTLALWESTLSSICNNTIENRDFILYESINISITNNSLSNGTITFDDSDVGGVHSQQPTYETFFLWESIWSHNIDGNLIDGNPFYYYSFKSNFTVPQDAACVIITKCSDFQINGLQEQSPIHISFSRRGDILHCNYFKMSRTLSYGHISSIIRVDKSENIAIRDCIMKDCYSGIDLMDSNNLVIENVSIVNCSGGIHSYGNDVCKIKNNTVSFSQGIVSAFDMNGLIDNNTCEQNDGSGIHIGEVHSEPDFPFVLKNNYCTNNSNGIRIRSRKSHSDNIICENNYCSNNEFDGILIQNSGSIIRRNICNFNGRDGISIVWSDDKSIITRNTCKTNQNYGLNISNFYNQNLIYHNNLIGNNEGGIQAFDDGSENLWNHSDKGNYWSDYALRYPNATSDGTIWSQPYKIEGSELPEDYFPLVKPIDIYHIPPVANAGKNITINQHQTVNFTARGSYGFPPIINYTWTFDYNSSPIHLYGPAPSFTFHDMGTYPVTLTVTNENDETDTDRMTVTVLDGEAPTANAGEDVTIEAGGTVHFDGSASSDRGSIVNYSWNFTYDDKNISLFGKMVDYTFGIPGQYEVILNVRDAMGNRATDEINVTVLDTTPPYADAGDDITVNVGERAFFNGSMSSDNVAVVNYTWEFTYDHTEYALYGMYQSFTFAIPGKYNVNLTVRDPDGNRGRDNLTVTVIGEYIPGLSDNNQSDSDGDGWNDTFENTSGSNPYDPASTPFDLDGDGWDNSYEEEVGSDPLNSSSIPSDRDGDGHPNDEDAYPDDPGKWKWDPEDDLLPEDGGTDGGESDDRTGAIYVWAGIGVLCLVITSVIVWVYFARKRKGKSKEDAGGDTEPDGDGEEDEERLGRVKKGGGG